MFLPSQSLSKGTGYAWGTLRIGTGDKILTRQVFDALATDRGRMESVFRWWSGIVLVLEREEPVRLVQCEHPDGGVCARPSGETGAYETILRDLRHETRTSRWCNRTVR